MSEPLHELEMTAEQTLEALGEGLFDATQFLDERFHSRRDDETVKVKDRSPLMPEPPAVPVAIQTGNHIRGVWTFFTTGLITPYRLLYQNPYRIELRVLCITTQPNAVVVIGETASEVMASPDGNAISGYSIPLAGQEVVMRYTGDLWVNAIGLTAQIRINALELVRAPN